MAVKRTGKQKTAPTRQSVGRERATPAPIREVISHPSERIPVRSIAAASKLKGTVQNGKVKEQPGLLPLPARFNINADGSVMTPKQMYDTYVAPGTYNVSQAQVDSYARLYDAASQAQQARQSIASQAGSLVNAVVAVATDIPGIVQGDAATIADANAQATTAMNVLRNYGSQNHSMNQTSVGGTKGSKTIVDRSAAIRKAWTTRRQLYGSSGQKGK